MFNYEEFILERLLTESIVYYSPKLRGMLKKIDNPIANDLIEIEGDNLKDDISFIDIDESELGKLTFKTAKSMRSKGDISHQFLDEFNPVSSDNVYKFFFDYAWKPARNPIKIGKLVNTFFPGKYTPGDIEKFTNIFKSSIENTGERIIVVEGEAIGEWYDLNKYWKLSSTLGSSCMRAKSVDFFEMYNENPQSVRMVCLLDEDESGVVKLKARALVWKIDKIEDTVDGKEIKFDYFMDRQYCWDDSEIIKLRNYAEKNGWAYKTHNNHRDFEIVTFNGSVYSLHITTSVKIKKYSNYPYMDTFKRFNPKTGELFNDNLTDPDIAGGCYILESTRGLFEQIRDPEDYVYSDWFNSDYLRDECVWSERVNSFLPRNRTVRVDSGAESNRGIYPDNYEGLCWSSWSEEYFIESDAIWSEFLGDYILSGEEKEVVIKINSNFLIKTDYAPYDSGFIIPNSELEKMLWYQKTLEKCRWNDYDGFYDSRKTSLFRKNYKDEFIPKDIALQVLRLKDPINGLEFLESDEVDFLNLKVIPMSKITSIDWVEHSYNLKKSGVLDMLREKGFDMSKYDFYLSLS